MGFPGPSEDKDSDPEGTGTYLRDCWCGAGAGSETQSRTPNCRCAQVESGDTFRPPWSSEVPCCDTWSRCGTPETTWLEEGVADRALGDLGVKGVNPGTMRCPLDHLGVVWMEKRTYSTAWVTPTHACLCPYKYGRGAAVGPQSCSSIWNGGHGIVGQGRALFDTLVFSKGDAIGSEPQPVRRLWIIDPMAQRRRTPVW